MTNQIILACFSPLRAALRTDPPVPSGDNRAIRLCAFQQPLPFPTSTICQCFGCPKHLRQKQNPLAQSIQNGPTEYSKSKLRDSEPPEPRLLPETPEFYTTAYFGPFWLFFLGLTRSRSSVTTCTSQFRTVSVTNHPYPTLLPFSSTTARFRDQLRIFDHFWSS